MRVFMAGGDLQAEVMAGNGLGEVLTLEPSGPDQFITRSELARWEGRKLIFKVGPADVCVALDDEHYGCRAAQNTMLPTEVPPQTNKVWPVMNSFSAEAKNITARVTSLGLPSRFTGMDCSMVGIFGLSRGMMLWNTSVSAIGPGATVFTVMPNGASSRAQVRLMPIMPALVDE